VGAPPRWIDLVDPSEQELRAHVPAALHPTALRRLLAPHAPDDDARPRIDSYGDYVLGVLLLAVIVKYENRVYYQEVDFLLMPDRLVSVSKTPPGERPFDPAPAKSACRPDDQPGMFAFHLVDEVAERYLDLLDDLNEEIDELEDQVDTARPGFVRTRLSELRHDVLGIRRTLTPTRDSVHKIIDGRVEIEGHDLFPRDVELHFADAYDKLLRATEELEMSRDLVAGVRDYAQGKVSTDQNEVTKRLTMVASLLLVPTFIVGVYGQNFRDTPELHWSFGYWWSWGLIVATTLVQLAYFRWKRWL
jgi:magnesium transporter